MTQTAVELHRAAAFLMGRGHFKRELILCIAQQCPDKTFDMMALVCTSIGLLIIVILGVMRFDNKNT